MRQSCHAVIECWCRRGSWTNWMVCCVVHQRCQSAHLLLVCLCLVAMVTLQVGKAIRQVLCSPCHTKLWSKQCCPAVLRRILLGSSFNEIQWRNTSRPRYDILRQHNFYAQAVSTPHVWRCNHPDERESATVGQHFRCRILNTGLLKKKHTLSKIHFTKTTDAKSVSCVRMERKFLKVLISIIWSGASLRLWLLLLVTCCDECGKSWIIDLSAASHVGLTSSACKVWK
jgi:hypothetical protein